ncbi:thioesterase family protein [Exiguobacterium artemiae]|uniref:thioesterase family protein n=1 Tax=Exiguobacterium artemiae TaxID=340145 RepID=UPI0029656874|nr:thioesterase [Exiguobacterium sibiricum]MDW2884723.1 thioesterase [Exiguobacterium sibiricum]
MKNGLSLGDSAVIETTVTEEMFAQFEGVVVHPAYSTVSMVYHMEWAARKLILPYLEEQEEGVGGAVSLKHVGMATLGSTIRIEAVVSELTPGRVLAKVEVRHGDRVIGLGEVKQIILNKQLIQEKLTPHVF